MSESTQCRSLIVLALTLGVTACDDGSAPVALVEVEPLARLDVLVELQIATAVAAPGDKVNVAVAFPAPDSLRAVAIQGLIHFDPRRLRYAGQVNPENTLVTVNSSSADESGSLRFLSFRLDGLRARAAVVTFEVLERGYLTGLSFEPELAVSGTSEVLRMIVLRGIVRAPDLAVQGVTRETLSDHELAHLAGFRLGTAASGPQLVLSSVIQIGDCNQDAIINALDLIAVARVAVGLDAAPADPSDYRICDVDDSGTLNVLDVLDISRFAVGVPVSSAPVGFRYEPMALGHRHTCALDEVGRAYCWGRGTRGALGDGLGTNSESPVAVTGGHTFTALTAGENFTCGLDTAGQAWCWGGEASRGTLGDGMFTDSDVPVPVSGGHSFVTLSMVVDDHTCGIEATGAAWCWGQQQGWGRLGDGVTTTDQGEPVPVAGGIAFVDIAAAWFYTCAIDVNGQAFCWGTLAGFAATPDSVGIGQTFTAIAAGFTHACALDTTGSAYCWGTNEFGQLGDGSFVNSQTTPVSVAGGHSFARIVAARRTTCGIDLSGQAYCWGTNEFGQLGDGTTGADCTSDPCRNIPVAVEGGHTFAVVEGGAFHSCGVDDGGAIWCWGDNTNGALGVGPKTAISAIRASPTATVSMPSNTGIAAGTRHACVLTSGQAQCWGWNQQGQLGNGTQIDANTPSVVLAPETLTSMALGLDHSCGLGGSGNAYCWGSNSAGELGDGSTTDALSPVAVSGGHTFASIYALGRHTCGLDSQGTALCWGNNLSGQLGDSTFTTRSLPDTVGGGHAFSAFAGGSDHTCGLVAGQAYCWGWNPYGQLGDGSLVNKSSPVQVGGGFTFAALFAVWGNTCGLTSAGVAYCWGLNSSGQLGDGTTSSASLPIPVSGEHVFDVLMLGRSHTCGIEAATNQLFCWGSNDSGELGDGTTTARLLPTAVAGGPATWLDGAAGLDFTCARDLQASVFCWGSNRQGQLSIGGVTPRSLVPVAVLPFG